MNLLISSGGSGRRARLVKAFQAAISHATPPGKTFVADADENTPGLFNAEGLVVPLVTAPDFFELMTVICNENKIEWIVPTTDADVLHFARMKREYEKNNIRVLVSEPTTIGVCNDKWAFYLFFSGTDIRLPETSVSREGVCDKFPLIIKPRLGAGSRDIYIAKNDAELEFFLGYVDEAEPVVQEYIVGREFTIDVLLDLDGRPISVVPRERRSTRAGVIDVGVTVFDETLIEFGRKVAEILPFIGPINIQTIVPEDGVPVLIEINARFSGGISLTLASGADFVKWSLQMMGGEKVEPRIGEFTDRLMMMVYEDAVYKLVQDAID